MAHDVFISYASSDKVVADAVCSQLESLHRIRCWIAPRDVTPGASWAESIIDALDGSKTRRFLRLLLQIGGAFLDAVAPADL